MSRDLAHKVRTTIWRTKWKKPVVLALLESLRLTMKFLHAQISEEFNVAVLITNQVMSDPSGGAMFVADPKKPVSFIQPKPEPFCRNLL